MSSVQSPPQAQETAARGVVTTFGLLAGLLALALVVVSVGTGVPATDSLILAALVLLQVGAGAALWSWLVQDRGPVELFGMGIALGTGLAVLSGVGVSLLGGPVWGWAVLPVGVLMLAGARRLRRGSPSTVPSGTTDRASWAALAIGAVMGLGFIAINLRNYPLTWTGTWSGYHTDMPFFEALATSLARLGPLDSIFFSGGQIRYHWMSYAWAGQLTESAGAPPFVVLTRVVPVVTVAGAISLIVAWSRRVSPRPWVPTLAILLLLSGGFLGAVYGGVLNFDSPSQSFGVLWLLAYCTVLMGVLTTGAKGRVGISLLVVLGVVAFLLGAGKISAVVPALAGVALLAVVGVARREAWWPAAMGSAAMSFLAAGLAYLLVLSGSSGSGGLGVFDLLDRASSQQGLNPQDTMNGVIAGTAILIVAMAARWAGLGWLLLRPEHRWQPMTIFGLGLALAGVGAVAAFNGLNEIWFGLAASAPLAVLSAQGVGDAVDRVSAGVATVRRRVLIGSVASAAVIYTVVWAFWQTGASGGNVFVSTWRWAGPLVGVALAVALSVAVARWSTARWSAWAVIGVTATVLVLVTVPGRALGLGTGQIGILQPGLRSEWFRIGKEPPVRGEDWYVVNDWTREHLDAATWLRTNADPSDLLATNRTFGPMVPGLTGLPTYASALQYQAPYGYPSYARELEARDARVAAFLHQPSAVTAAPLCEAGITWLWIDPELTETRTWEPWASVEYQNDKAIIARVSGCQEN